jgi:hypothetical protein
MQNFTVERGAKLYPKKSDLPWEINQLRGPAGEKFVSLSTPAPDKEIVILRMWAESNYENILKMMKSIIEPEHVELVWEDGKTSDG